MVNSIPQAFHSVLAECCGLRSAATKTTNRHALSSHAAVEVPARFGCDSALNNMTDVNLAAEVGFALAEQVDQLQARLLTLQRANAALRTEAGRLRTEHKKLSAQVCERH